MSVPLFITGRHADIAVLCQQNHVLKLELFGSATRDDFSHTNSDLDFLVQFEELAPIQYYEAFFSLKEGLEALFGRRVDLVVERTVRNPFLRQQIDAERQAVYAA